MLQDEGKSIQINQNKYAAEMPEIPVSPNRKSDIISSPNRNEKIQKLRTTVIYSYNKYAYIHIYMFMQHHNDTIIDRRTMIKSQE